MKAKKAKEPIRIRFKELTDGNKSIYLDIYRDGKRRYEFLKLYLIPEKTPFDKQQNKATMDAANAIKAQRVIELANNEAGIRGKNDFGKMYLYDLMQLYAGERDSKGQSKSNADSIKAVALHLKEFSANTRLQDVDLDFCKEFARYIQTVQIKGGKQISVGGARAYFVLFNAALNLAVRRGFIESNPIAKMELEEKPSKPNSQRDYLTEEELRALISTPCKANVKKPFLFSCFVGLRFGDIKRLEWSNIVIENGVKKVRVTTQKTKKPVLIPIPNAGEILPERGNAKDDDFVFDTVSNVMTNQRLAKWSEAAGIKGKHITFHTARHTYATLLLTKGADLYTVSKLLGHTEIATTQIYTEIIDKKKEEAANLLNGLI
jgi:integrase